MNKKTDMSKSEFINLILKSALLSNEGVQELAKTDDKVQNILEKTKKMISISLKVCYSVY